MARGKGGLGRGLDSLFEDAAPVFESEHAAVETLPLREIEPDPDQPRKTFEQETLSELAASIAEHGLLQPIAVRPRPMGGYSIVAGERRWRASRMAGLTEVPVVIKDVSDEQAMELALNGPANCRPANCSSRLRGPRRIGPPARFSALMRGDQALCRIALLIRFSISWSRTV